MFVLAKFGGKRRGADFGGVRAGKNDVIVDGWSIECKLLSRPSYQNKLDACRQAENNAESPYDIPVAVIKRKGRGTKNKDALVCMRLETFREWFL
jgi:hypothetical protein